TADAIREAVTPQIARATLQAASATDVTELLPHVAAPTLVLHRRDMSQIPVGVSRSLAEALPRRRLVILDGAQPTLFMGDAALVQGGPGRGGGRVGGLLPGRPRAPRGGGHARGGGGPSRHRPPPAAAGRPVPPGARGAAMAGRRRDQPADRPPSRPEPAHHR